MNNSMANNSDQISEQASHWFVRLNADVVSDQTRREFHEWLSDNPLHGNEFAAISAIWAAMDEVDSLEQLKLQSIVHDQIYAPKSYDWLKPVWLIAACLLITVALILLNSSIKNPSPVYYATNVGETETISFEDGSSVHLNTHSKLAWFGGGKERKAILYYGEALFDVEPDPSRPFLVEAGSGVIRVLGTTFNVYKTSNEDVLVTVLEGKVSVENIEPEAKWERSLVANQEMSYRDTGVKVEVSETLAKKKASWIDGVIILENMSLINIVDELSRYTDARIIIGDPKLYELRLGGVISVKDIRDSLSFLEEVAPIKVANLNGVYVLNSIDVSY